MALSVRTPRMAGNPLGDGEDWGDSPYGSLITLGPRKLKKKPVLVLADEELAQAHLAMAMGGAEIMEMMPDPVAAPRPRQPAVMLGLVPMGAEERDEDPVAWTPPAPEEDEAWEPLPDFEEPEPEEADIQTWEPEPEPEALDEAPYAGDEATGLPPLFGAPLADSEPQVPSIEEQLERMRERMAKRAASTDAADPAPPVAEPGPTTIERLEIDDWTGSDPLHGFIPPQEQDLPAPSSAIAQPELEPEPEPEIEPEIEPEPDAFHAPAPEPAALDEPQPVADAFEPDLPASLPEEDQAALDAWAEHVTPVTPPARRYGGIRARLRDGDTWQGLADDPAPGLLARLWGWLRGLF